MGKISGFEATCEACGWSASELLPTRKLALEAAFDHEYMRGCPARGELSPEVLGRMRADQLAQREQHHDRWRRREAMRRNLNGSQPMR